jgi:uncharacterized protein (DUF433 family)
MDLPDFLSREASGEIRLSGHRIGLYHVVHYYSDGYSAEMLACQYPTLSLALIHKVIGFYLDNKADVDTYVVACQESLRQQRAASPNQLALATLRERLAATHGADTA